MSAHATQILPFHGLRYAQDPLEAVTAPPYDVIDHSMQQKLYDANPHNVIRLILNAVQADDSLQDNAYSRASGYFRHWQEEGVLAPEPQPAMYAYSQRWQDEQSKEMIERKGLLALLKLEPYETKRVLPHEWTLRGPKLDRMNLMKSALGNFSPIFMVYADPAGDLEKQVFQGSTQKDDLSWAVAKDADQTEHRFAALSDPTLLQAIQGLMAPHTLLIADGHHRYETALAFQAEARNRFEEQTGQSPPQGSLLSDYIMVFIANLHDPGLKVYPTDRVLYQWPEDYTPERFEKALQERFDLLDPEDLKTITPDFIYQTPGQEPQPLKLKDNSFLHNLHPDLHQLDTAILEEAVFKSIFKIPGEKLKASHHLGFYRNPKQVKALLENQEAVAVFYMATPPLTLIKSLCEAGHRMPQKSTYFYPKLLSGLAFYSYAPLNPKFKLAHALSGVLDEAKPLPLGFFATEKESLDFSVALRPD